MRRCLLCWSCGLLALAVLVGYSVDSAVAKEGKKHSPRHHTTESKTKQTTSGKAAEKSGDKTAAVDSAKPTTYKVKKGPFRIEVNLDGVLEAQNMSELTLRPQEWAGLSVLKAVEHGAVVKQGDLVLALDTEKIDRAIADQEKEIQLTDLSIKQAEEAIQALEKSAPLDLESIRRTDRIAKEDSQQYFATERKLAVKTADFMLQSAKDALEYEEEELRQLEKMYRADDIREETERIVLKRARDAVKRAQFNLLRTKAECDDFLKFVLPRRDDKIKETTQRAELDWNRAQLTFPMALSKHRLELEKLKIQQTLTHERLLKLVDDRTAMTVKAPCNGIVYYGKCARGKWGSATDPLHRGSTIMPNEVFMTIVEPRPLLAHVTVPEAQLQYLRGGLKAVVEPAGYSDQKLSGIVERVGVIPISAGSFDAQIALATDGPAEEALMPGMACTAKLVPWKKADDLAVPSKAVFSDDLDVQRRFVYVVAKKAGAKAEKREVTLGKRNDKQVEILSGLHEGEEILLERPKDEQ